MMARCVSKIVLVASVGRFHADRQTRVGTEWRTSQDRTFPYRTIIGGENAGNIEISIRKSPESGEGVIPICIVYLCCWCCGT
jgi:hypothetical protein